MYEDFPYTLRRFHYSSRVECSKTNGVVRSFLFFDDLKGLVII